MTTDIILERPLSLYEHFFRLRSEYKFYKTFQVTATYSQPLTHATLISSVRKVLLDYHILACNLVKKCEDVIMSPVSRICLEDVLIEKDHTEYLTEGLVNEHAMKFLNDFSFELYNDKPLFKLVLFGPCTLSIVLEHALFDGMVGPYMHQEILHNLNAAEASVAPVDTVLFDLSQDMKRVTHSLPPPIDDFLPWDVDWTGGDPCHYSKTVPKELTKFKGRFLNSRDYTLAFKLVHFDHPQVTTILQACKAQGVTLTAYLELIYALTFQPVFGEHYTVNKVAMALRRHFSKDAAPDHYKHFFDYPHYKNMGNSPSTGVAQNLPPIEQFSWDTVKEINDNLLKSVKNPNVLSMSAAFKKAFGDFTTEHFFNKDLGHHKAETLKLSNLGMVQLPADTPWTIGNMVFSQDVSPTTSDFMVNVVSTIAGLNIVISYIDSSFADGDYDNFDHFITAFKENALKYANQP